MLNFFLPKVKRTFKACPMLRLFFGTEIYVELLQGRGRCQQSVSHTGEGHDPLFAINFAVGSSLADSMANYLICVEGDCFVAIFSASQTTQVWDIL